MRNVLRKSLKYLLRTLVILYIVFGVIVLIMRYVVLPKVDGYRPQIQAMLQTKLGLPVTIDNISADWVGLRPSMTVTHVRLQSPQGEDLLHIDRIYGELSWTSLFILSPRFHFIEFSPTTMSLGRSAVGQWTIGGISLSSSTNSDNSSFVNWLLAQHHIIFHDVQLTWKDHFRRTPLFMAHVKTFEFWRGFRNHNVRLIAQTVTQPVTPFEFSGKFSDVGPELRRWSGEIYTATSGANLRRWAPWIPLPTFYQEGVVALQLWTKIHEGHLRETTANIQADNLHLQFANGQQPFSANHLQTTAGYLQDGDRLTAWIKDTTVIAPDRPALSIQTLWWNGTSDLQGKQSLIVKGLWLQDLHYLLDRLPAPQNVITQVTQMQPAGYVESLDLRFASARQFRVSMAFRQLSLTAVGAFPGVTGLSGRIDGDQNAGTAHLEGEHMKLELPQVFDQANIPLQSLMANLQWRKVARGWYVDLQKVQLSNNDIKGVSVSGSYLHADRPEERSIDLSGEASEADAAAIWRYLPLLIGGAVPDWLHKNLTAGTLSDMDLVLRGRLHDFPYLHAGQGLFRIGGSMRDTVLNYATDWPRIEGATGTFLFVADKAFLNVKQGSVAGIPMQTMNANFTNIGHDTHLQIQAVAQGENARFLQLVNGSPLSELANHTFTHAQADGQGVLNLKIEMPIAHPANLRPQVDYQFLGGSLQIMPEIPPIGKVRGHVLYSHEQGLTSDQLQGEFLGSPASARINTDNSHITTISAKGQAAMDQLRRHVPHPWLTHLQGTVPWTMELQTGHAPFQIRVRSSLQGLSTTFPAPLAKVRDSLWPLSVTYKKDEQGADLSWNVEGLQGNLQGTILLNKGNSIQRGTITYGRSARMPDTGLRIAVTNKALDIDAWQDLLPQGDGPPPENLSVLLDADNMKFKDRIWHQTQIRATYRADRWHVRADSTEMAGTINWHPQLRELDVDLSHLNWTTSTQQVDDDTKLEQWPQHMKLAVQSLHVTSPTAHREYGRVLLESTTTDQVLTINRLDVNNADFSLTATGSYELAKGTTLNGELKSTDNGTLETILKRMKLPTDLRGGEAVHVSAALQWNGFLTTFDPLKLSGNGTFTIDEGAFTKVEPGVGRLLSLFSLQNVASVLTLSNLRNVFDQGLAFEHITGKVNLTPGMVAVEDMNILSSAAYINIKGNVDLNHESQNLQVKVLPNIGDITNLAVTAANPLIGGIYFIVSRIFKTNKLINRIFVKTLNITGTWSNPIVDKTATTTITPSAMTGSKRYGNFAPSLLDENDERR